MKKVIYPCIITEEDNVYYAEFPDFGACFTDGESFEEAVINAKDVLEGTLTVYAKKGIDFPEANMDIVAEKGRIVFVDVWLAPILDRASNQAVKKTLTIPKWLNDSAEAQSVNFSSVLQTALKEELGIH